MKNRGMFLQVLLSMVLILSLVVPAAAAGASGGVPEAVRDGETGFLVPPGESGAVAEAVIRLLENDSLRERMGEAARQFALQREAKWREFVSQLARAEQ